MNTKLRTLADLKKGETAVIKDFSDTVLSHKLLEMGCLPGNEILLKKVAPLGDPMSFEVLGYTLSLRKKEASSIILA